MSFSALGLVPDLLKALDERGYATPTPIQIEAIPIGLAGRDIVGSAQTGTGKTAAFLLPILQRLIAGRNGAMRALVLVPTRELAEQVLQSARAYGRHVEITATAVYGGVAMGPQTAALRRGTDIVIATPGRLLDHIERGHVDASRLQVLVLDEADRMLDMGFAPDVNRILDTLPSERQTMLFSATISADVDRLARRALSDHAAVEIGRRAQPADGVDHVVVAVDHDKKRDALLRVLEQVPPGRTLIFTRTKFGADKLAWGLRKAGRQVTALHGNLTQGARDKALERFREGRTPILVATDVAARGIDVTDILLVVNYDVPQDPEIYVHRVGRTARAGNQGVAITLMAPHEWLLMHEVEKLLGRYFPREVVPGFEPSVAPIQPHERPAPPKRNGTGLGPRRGKGRRR